MRNSRGYRNNNPGNLRFMPIPWQGKKPLSANTDKAFEQFYELRYGVRAMIMDIRTKIASGKNTIPKLLAIYAPPTENNTTAYSNTVARLTGFGLNQVLGTDKDTLKKIVIAMSKVENGDALTPSEFEAGYALVPNTSSVKKKES